MNRRTVIFPGRGGISPRMGPEGAQVIVQGRGLQGKGWAKISDGHLCGPDQVQDGSFRQHVFPQGVTFRIDPIAGQPEVYIL